MKLTHLRTNHVETPLGLYLEHPVFSWVAEDTTDKRQVAAQIVVQDRWETLFTTAASRGGSPPWASKPP